jgi:uroporphyrinogen-III synthase
MTNSSFHVLITRPESAGRELQQHLNSQGFVSYCQPFFDYQANDTLTQLTALQHQLITPILIFVSVAAVEFANKLKPITSWSQEKVIAVGSATLQALKALGVDAIMPERHDSEGLLALAPLQNVETKNVLIIRGDGGRELIAEELSDRGASVHYFESYRRVWRNSSIDVIKTWQQQQINCILVTSNALLEFIVNLIKDSDTYWQEDCIWLVASNRIANKAKSLGLKRVINANGANKQAVTAALSSLTY